ncbi:GntR family transcriptional regulator [Pacificimonas sp. ICDLI1SI03]
MNKMAIRQEEPADPPRTRAGAIPLYHQIYVGLRDEIVRGIRAHGTSLPTEMELAKNEGVSRITARRALDELAAGGFVERRRRHGTRVTYRTPNTLVESDIDQAVESLIAFGQNTKVKVLEVALVAAGAALATQLGVKEGDQLIRAVRLRFSKGGPLGLIVSHMRSDLGIEVTPERLMKAPILSLLVDAGLGIGGAVQTIEATVAESDMAELLECEPLDPILIIERQVEDGQQRPVLVTRASYRADRYRITLDMHQHGQFSPRFS